MTLQVIKENNLRWLSMIGDDALEVGMGSIDDADRSDSIRQQCKEIDFRARIAKANIIDGQKYND